MVDSAPHVRLAKGTFYVSSSFLALTGSVTIKIKTVPLCVPSLGVDPSDKQLTPCNHS